jgi:hypothetical protein
METLHYTIPLLIALAAFLVSAALVRRANVLMRRMVAERDAAVAARERDLVGQPWLDEQARQLTALEAVRVAADYGLDPVKLEREGLLEHTVYGRTA